MAFEMDVSLKIHYIYHSEPRCTPLTASLADLVNLGLSGFQDMLKENVPYLGRFDSIRLTFLDEDDTWIDLSDSNYITFLKNTRCTGGSDFPKLNVKVFDGASPAPSVSKYARTDATGVSRQRLEKRFSSFGTENDSSYNDKFIYKSPVQIDIELKEEELDLKRAELRSLETAYQDKASTFNLNVVKDKSKKRCAKCHLRVNHTQRNCDIGLCEDIRQCGELDYHPEQKAEINDLVKKPNIVERDIKSLEVELKVKKDAQCSSAKTFERRIRDFVINSNPEKYLINGGPGTMNVILQADIAILKRHYHNRIPENLKDESRYFTTIIASQDSQRAPRTTPKNPVQAKLESNAIYPVRFPPPTATVTSPPEQWVRSPHPPPPLPPPPPPPPPCEENTGAGYYPY